MEKHRRDGQTYRLHAAGYVTDAATDEALGNVHHVAYSMAPVADGWVFAYRM